MARRIQLRRDTAANWSATNPTLAQGEIGVDLTNNKIKIGTGTTAWNSLGYFDDKETVLSNYAGHIVPSTDNTYDLGAPDKQWRDIFVSDGSIYIGDIKMSNDGGQLVVQQVTNPGEETEAPVPDAPGVVTTDRLVHGDKEVVLGSDGTLTLPPQTATLQTVDQIATAKIYRATNSTNATAIQEAKDTWFEAELTFADVRDQDAQLIAPATRPWAGMPSYEAYPLIQSYTPPVGVPLPPGLIPSANTAINAYLLWKELVSNIDIVSGDKIFSFENTGKLRIPGVVTSDDLLTLISDGTATFNSASVVADGDNGNVFVKTRDGNAGTDKTWTFGKEGNLTFPYNHEITTGEGDMVITSPGGLTLAKNTGDDSFTWDSVVSVSNNVVISTNIQDSAKQWQFKTDGDLQLPQGGDILDSTGNSVLGGGGGSISVGTGVGPSIENVTEILINGTVTEIEPGLVGISVVPPIANTKKGFINLVGDKPNEYDDIWFESVAVHEQYAYVVGGDYYVDNSEDRTKIYKFSLETGNQVWVKEIVAGRDAQINFDISSEVITIDSIEVSGEGYIVGEELYFGGGNWGGNNITNMVTVVVDTVAPGTGGILTASIKPGYDLIGIGDGAFAFRTADNDDAYGLPGSIAYDSYLDKLIIVSNYRSGQGDVDFDGSYFWTNVYVVDPTTAEVNQTLTLGSAGDIYANSLKLKNAAGGLVICGEKYGEFRQFGTLTLLAGYDGYFDILKSDLDPEHYPGSLYDSLYDFWVSGTGISTVENVDSVNDYPNLPTTVREGSGAVFEISDLGDGNYYTTGTLNSGINYRAGHKIKVLGTDLGGATPANDCIITVDSVGPDGDVFGWSVSGTAAGNTFTTYSGVSGTAYQSGSGLTVNAFVNRQTGVVSLNYFNNSGSGYVTGDVVTIAGTVFSGGTSPANDVTFTINSVGGGGAANGWNNETVTGSAPSDRLRIYVNSVDFTPSDGSWTMKQNLGGEAFVWTPTWSNAIGGPSGDRFYDVCYSQDGNSIFAVGRGRYETDYDQALVVKFNASTGAVIWGKDIKFSEAATNGREARSVCLVPGSSDLIVAGAWYNDDPVYEDELILTRITEAGVAVWQKTYLFNDNDGSNIDIDYEMKVEALGNNVLVSLETQTPQFNRALSYLIINPTTGAIIDSRFLASDGNGNRNFYEVPTPNFSDIYTDGNGDSYAVMVGKTYVPTDNYYNAFITKLPLDGYKTLAIGEWISIGEHILGKYNWDVTTVTSAFDSFTATEHVDTIEQAVDQRGYTTRTPDSLLKVFRTDITKDSDGYLEFGDGSKQSFATDKIPQIPAANDYYLTEQDSGKHIFFENENGYVYIPHRTVKDLPVGFTFTVVNTTGSDCWVTTQNEADGSGYRARLKLAGRNIDTYTIGIPDSGSGSMVTFLKIKSGYSMLNTDYDDEYPDVWIVSGPGDIYDND